jgi:hypothetical protein
MGRNGFEISKLNIWSAAFVVPGMGGRMQLKFFVSPLEPKIPDMNLPLNQPQGGNEMPRFAGRGTMLRLPSAESPAGLDVAFIGVPLDIGTSLRAGTRFGPRSIRNESVMIRPYNMATGGRPRRCAHQHVQPAGIGADHRGLLRDAVPLSGGALDDGR